MTPTVDAAVTQVKKGLESQGLTGLEDKIFGKGNTQDQADFQMETIRRRKPFRGQEIYLPVVRHKEGSSMDSTQLSGAYFTAYRLVQHQTTRSERISTR